MHDTIRLWLFVELGQQKNGFNALLCLGPTAQECKCEPSCRKPAAVTCHCTLESMLKVCLFNHIRRDTGWREETHKQPCNIKLHMLARTQASSSFTKDHESFDYSCCQKQRLNFATSQRWIYSFVCELVSKDGKGRYVESFLLR